MTRKSMNILISLVLFASASCMGRNDNPNKKELWRGKYRVTTKEIFRIGSDNLFDDKYTFSAI